MEGHFGCCERAWSYVVSESVNRSGGESKPGDGASGKTWVLKC